MDTWQDFLCERVALTEEWGKILSRCNSCWIQDTNESNCSISFQKWPVFFWHPCSGVLTAFLLAVFDPAESEMRLVSVRKLLYWPYPDIGIYWAWGWIRDICSGDMGGILKWVGVATAFMRTKKMAMVGGFVEGTGWTVFLTFVLLTLHVKVWTMWWGHFPVTPLHSLYLCAICALLLIHFSFLGCCSARVCHFCVIVSVSGSVALHQVV